MTDYNDGKWHGWNGGECPVHPNSKVDYVTDRVGLTECISAEDVIWESRSDNFSPVRAFRVAVEHKEPREFWVFLNGHGDLIASRAFRRNATHVREVLE